MLDKINAELKAANIGVAVEQRGNRLYARGTFPPKPGSGKTKPYQQVIALGIYANSAGFRRAKAEAIRIGGLLACKEFRWEDFGFSLESPDETPETIASWLEKFEQDYFRRHAPTIQSACNFKNSYRWAWRRIFGDTVDLPMTAENCLMLLLNNTTPDTSARQNCCNRLATLLKFAKISLDLRPYRGNYTPDEFILPTDDEIVAWHDRIPNSQWRWAYGVMAAYGIRNHELYYLDLKDFDKPPGILRIKPGGKTGPRSVWPYYPEWYERFNLAECDCPTLSGRNNQSVGTTVRGQFFNYGVPFHPYALRHSWAVRTIGKLPLEIASQMMGHSIAIHCKTYHKWINEIHFQEVWEKSRSLSSVF